ncbi:tRNA (N6-threonylcarbamoyladenosine(37)-N6)-methyltransferase TrmO [Thalassotalea ponticola]|uniref:tRNA (N6-threonylcarbamoyladenosine(37)-N6)-methyltransferase TrmO n=1 Tax=Thalassotalea ponticola TaxID=1523392 RepID=UPI0025B55469|nr:tRNA (N6-threonylcarbamoyladenosine(37)-N6)-methyltransferase TrmO [Thalassotalea ponticola]MDN3652205.1 tRNA (N6-threonylcarbamoyladenosine(37)-N6)-methyltransferase TrmO [Thalassotalea ponticola]
MDKCYQMSPIAVVHSPYKEKFAIPRQPNLVTAAHGKIELLLAANQHELVRDIEQHSHLWLVFVFHQTIERGWKPLVKAPRLGGNVKTGVLACRTTHRPNPIGISVVKFQGLSTVNGHLAIDISGLDLLDGTPILDIKPYIPYSDCVPQARSMMAPEAQKSSISITFSSTAQQQLAHYQSQYANFELLIRQVLAQDPRPAYRKRDLGQQEYGMRLYDCNIRWQINADICTVVSIDSV